jgi:adhesin HecA-like repeat protein
MYRTVKDADATVFLKVVPPVEGLGTNSLLTVGKNCKIKFVNKYKLQQGKIDASADGAKIEGLASNGGTLRLLDPGTEGTYVASILGDVEWNGGDIVFDFTTSGVVATLEMTDSFLMAGGSVNVPPNQTLSVDVDFAKSGGSVSVMGAGALLDVTGNLTHSGGTLTAGGTGGKVSVDGQLTLSGGTLSLDNGLLTAWGGLTVQSAGTLSVANSATITGDVVNNATLTLAASATLNVTGNYTQSGTLNLSLASSTTYSKLNISGLATLSGTLYVSLAPPTCRRR